MSKEESLERKTESKLVKGAIVSKRKWEGSNDEKTGKRVTNIMLAKGSSASKVELLGNSEDDENGKEQGIK